MSDIRFTAEYRYFSFVYYFDGACFGLADNA